MKRILPLLLVLALVVMLGDLGFSQGNYETYVVQKGETLSELAIKFDIPMKELAEFNSQAIEDIIYAGQGIKIPLKQPIVENTVTVIDEKVSRDWNFWVIGLSCIVIILLLLGLIITYILRRRNRKVEQVQKQEEIKFKIKGVKYTYCPQVDPQGRFISLYKNGTGGYCAFVKIVDLRRSLKASFEKDPSLIEQEIEAGRLIKKS